MVENKWGGLDAACSTIPKAGMEIRTNTERLRKYRKNILELLLANHCRDCTTVSYTHLDVYKRQAISALDIVRSSRSAFLMTRRISFRKNAFFAVTALLPAHKMLNRSAMMQRKQRN